MLSILSIIIGIVFVLLLFSILTSTALELLDALLSLRGRHLRNTLENMLGNWSHDFFRHPIFRQLSYASTNKQRISDSSLPGWINKDTFSSIVMDILNVKNVAELEQKINAMDDGEMKRLMLFLLRQANYDLATFRQKVEHWFEEIMQRATDWYKRNTKWWLFGIGVVLAGIFNADTIQIYKSLSANAAARDQLTALAENFTASRDSVAGLQFGQKTPEQAKAEFDAIRETYQQIVQSPLGLGWTDQQGGAGLNWYLVKIAGLLLTGLAVTMGAPFWFDILKKLISLRSVAPAPPPAANSTNAPPANNPSAQAAPSPAAPAVTSLPPVEQPVVPAPEPVAPAADDKPVKPAGKGRKAVG